jgi:hypothetical protein
MEHDFRKKNIKLLVFFYEFPKVKSDFSIFKFIFSRKIFDIFKNIFYKLFFISLIGLPKLSQKSDLSFSWLA